MASISFDICTGSSTGARRAPCCSPLKISRVPPTSVATTGTPHAAASSSTTKADADAFPVTIEHALGKTTIEEEPKRVATLGWSDQDHAVALIDYYRSLIAVKAAGA